MLTTTGTVLERILSSFLSNTVKFSIPGTPLFVDLEQTPEEVIISATDDGPEISDRDRAGTFFGRIRTQGARPTGGDASNSMGLHLAGELAQRIGAKLAYEDAPASGTVFTVSILCFW